jgi:hypothetical protein
VEGAREEGEIVELMGAESARLSVEKLNLWSEFYA